MKNYKYVILGAISAFVLLGCGGGSSDIVKSAKSILLGETFYRCKGDRYSKNEFLEDKVKWIIYNKADDSEL